MSQRYLGGIITANPTAPTLASASGVWTLEQQFQYAQTIQPETIGHSLRFRSSASAYMNRTPASASNRTTWTMSMWVKRGGLGAANYTLFSATGYDIARFSSLYTDSIEWEPANLAGYAYTPAVFRDPSAWYHIVFTWDSTNATAANRMRIYVNGVLQTLTYTVSAPAQNTQSYWNSNVASTLGCFYNTTQFFDGYMAETYFIDGQALTPSSFGAYDSAGVWQPLAYTGTYGTNGFYLDYSNTTSTTTLGYDTSGNGNNWTTNNFSLTAGSTYDAMIDSPSNLPNSTAYGIGNYCVMNRVDFTITDGSVTNGNLTLNGTSNWNTGRASMGVSSGKWYWETVHTVYNQSICGIADNAWPTTTYYPGYSSTGYSAGFGNAGYKYVDGAAGAVYGTAFVIGDVIGYALDMDAGTLTCYINNTSQGTMVSGLAAYAPIFPALAAANGAVINANFGQRPFTYTPPTGFKALNTANLPASTINNGAQYMAATLWTGDGTSSRAIDNSTSTTIATSFKPDLVWLKARTGASNLSHIWTDSVRGATLILSSDQTSAESTLSTGVTAFNSNGFQIGTWPNSSSQPFVGWQWKAAGSTVSNTSGSITSTVSANTTAGFSIVAYTGTGANATVGHGLGVAPKFIIFKGRSNVSNWWCYHIGLTSAAYTISLNQTIAQLNSPTSFQSTAPTSSVFYIGTDGGTNTSANPTIAYCWAEVAGYSKFGSYTGNGSTDGPFVYLGFRPRYVLLKISSTTGDWVIYDTSRNTYNVTDLYLYPNSSAAEGGSGTPRLDILSNGFKLRQSGQDNTSGATYIYAAFAENPFNISRAR